MKKIISTLMMLFCLATMSAQQFFNLRADEVRIDSILPRFSHSINLTGNYADTIYTVSLRYPEFIDMTATDQHRYDSITGGNPLPTMPEIEQMIVSDRRRGSIYVSFTPLVERNGKKQILVSFMLHIDKKPVKRAQRKANRQNEATLASRYANHSVLAEGRWAKIRIPSSGVYQLTEGLINQAGFNDLSRVKLYGYGGNLQNEQLEADYLIQTDDLHEVPTYQHGNRRLFYANGPVSWKLPEETLRTRNPYSDYGYYFITQTETEPLKVDSATFVSSFYPSANDYHSLHEVDNYAWYHSGRNLFEADPIAANQTKSVELNVPAGNTKGSLYISVSADTQGSIQIALNDSTLGSIKTSLSNLDIASVRASIYEVSNLKETNKITITNEGSGTARLDHVAITFDKPRPLTNLNSQTLPVPEYVHNITNQDLHAHGPADMVIIIPTSQKLRTQAERIAALHTTTDSMRVVIVPADELYNEFSSGTPDANAYRRYLKMLYDRAETEADMPKYLLLFGDCAWDNRLLSSDWRWASADDLLLSFQSENSVNQYSSYIDDSWFGMLDDGEGINQEKVGRIDLGVGRFPVRTEDEAKVMTDKTINYVMNNNSGDWQNIIMAMGDDDPGKNQYNTHMNDINQMADETNTQHPAYRIKKVMWDAYTRESSSTGNRYPDIENIVKQQQTNGALIMNYAGHGSPTSMSHERVLVLEDFSNFKNTNLPLWIINACDIMPFDANMSTIGEEAVRNSRGGAIAVFSTSRTVYASSNKQINLRFMRYALSLDDNGQPMKLGDAVRLAKNTCPVREFNTLHYHLLGDPAISLQLPTLDIVIDSINGIPVTETATSGNLPQLRAGTIATISAHIERDKQLASDFNGRMTATVLDTEETIVCKRNLSTYTGAPFTFKDRTKTLYNGNDDVRNGQIRFSFAVPLDINYADASGKIIIHATSEDHRLTAHGQTEQFVVGGTGTMSNDSIGPSIYCYLNSPSFTDGGNVNSTPYFVAQITDQDGINASGVGIGHDMELIIDDEMTRTYSLNENFLFDFGSYTSGSTHYYIPELAPGRHQLKFRAWDVQNNSTTATLSFNVVKGLEPSLYGVDCTNNPATTNTTFIISHDRQGSNVDVDLEIFDTSGRLLWRRSESGQATGGTYTIDWDLTIDGGQRLHTGVYLYRVLIGSDGSKKASKAKKLIIISNK